MTRDERYNEVLKSHAGFLNVVGVASAGGGGFAAIADDNWGAAFIFLMLALSLHIAATEVLDRLRIS
jgi:hypothetical protein